MHPRGDELLARLATLAPEERDAATEAYLGIALSSLPAEASAPPGPHLIGYHASGVDVILRALEAADVGEGDLLVDLGAGLGKVVLLTRLLTDARARGIEVQEALVVRARRAAEALEVDDVTFVHGDVRDAVLDDGTVFFLYSPFEGPVLADVLARLHRVAQRRAIVVVALAVDLERGATWLVRRPAGEEREGDFWLTIYDSVVPGVPSRPLRPKRTWLRSTRGGAPMPTTSSAVRIAYDDEGQSETALLCLPGWCIERSIFAPLIECAQGKRRVLALDWRGHGHSGHVHGDFTAGDLVDDALAVVDASGASRIIPVAQAHAGWIAIELARRLGDRVPAIVFSSFMLSTPPPAFTEALSALQNASKWSATRDRLVGMWLAGGPAPLAEAVHAMALRHGPEMWGRAAREIGRAFEREESVAAALERLVPSRPVLHVFAQPRAPEVVAAHEAFARKHSWFRFAHTEGATHFPTFETPPQVLAAIDALPI